MARIREIVEGNQAVKAHKMENAVICQYQIVQDEDGDTLVHLSTFGSEQRSSMPKSSQSIQLDRRNAVELMVVLSRAFGLNYQS